jgi:hypothetical protein
MNLTGNGRRKVQLLASVIRGINHDSQGRSLCLYLLLVFYSEKKSKKKEKSVEGKGAAGKSIVFPDA